MAKAVKRIEATIDWQIVHSSDRLRNLYPGGVAMVVGGNHIQWWVFIDPVYDGDDIWHYRFYLWPQRSGYPPELYADIGEGPWLLAMENDMETQTLSRYLNDVLIDTWDYGPNPDISNFAAAHIMAGEHSYERVGSATTYYLRGLVLNTEVTWENNTTGVWPWGDESEIDDWEHGEYGLGRIYPVIENGYLRCSHRDAHMAGAWYVDYMIQPSLDNLTTLQAPVGYPVWAYLVDSSGLTEDKLL